jgi:Xaa-Pro aminopeptidase
MPRFHPLFRGVLPLFLVGCAAAPRPAADIEPIAAEAWDVPALPPAEPIAREEYAARRAALAAQIDGGVIVALGAAEPEADYLPFAQTPTLRYLTGITEPGAALVISKRDGRVEEFLFVRPRNPAREVWEGERLGAAGARALTGIPARSVEEFAPVVNSLLADAPALYTTGPLPRGEAPGAVLTAEQQVIARLADENPGVELASLGAELQRLRAAKSPAELDRIRRAAYITNLAQRAAIRTIEPGMNEFEIQALIEYTFRRYGAERPSFATIVGSGPNATTLHYRADDRFMQAGEVVVMDIGASYAGYAADITRTVPVSGTFSPEQRAIYEIVLEAQKAAEAAARPGATWNELNTIAERVIAEGLTELGLIESPTATYRCDSERFGRVCPQYRLFYMHGLGHGIGLDVHDPEVSYYGPFQVGSAFTIEPGIYIREDALDYLPDTPENRALIERLRPVVERYENIGVRIEDDYIITPEGLERISAGAPREIAEIEALAAQPSPATADRRPEVVEWYRSLDPR